ncbi:sensor histidine kinase [Solitalea lacus]|uniref:sensor histidine kinase n=1 Tax=Solitalea lacus TaxID=2911172 RepID=UPI001EDB9743|nr:histidine kinase [Solitalea lacus]UKJ06166.1 histidine kinase [Solitalea lacus]
MIYLLTPFYNSHKESFFDENYKNLLIIVFFITVRHAFVFYIFYSFLTLEGSARKKITLAITGFLIAIAANSLMWFMRLDIYYSISKSWQIIRVEIIRDITYNIYTLFVLAASIKLGKHLAKKQKENTLLLREKLNAELQLLKAQVHPHFLFNTLNNIYSFILTSNPIAPDLILKLSNLMHYIITECNHPKVQLTKEIEMIESYIELEKIRYGKRLDLDISIIGNLEHKSIAPLLLLPFIENSFKHGASTQLENSWIKVELLISERNLTMKLINSKPLDSDQHVTKNGGIGLVNVQKRLQLLYPNQHTLRINSDREVFSIYLEVALEEEFSSEPDALKEPYFPLTQTA